MYGKAAVAVVVEAACGRAVAVLLDGEDAAVRAVPGDFAVHRAGGVVARVGVFFQGEGRGLRGVAVLVVVLDDAAAVCGFAQGFCGGRPPGTGWSVGLPSRSAYWSASGAGV